MKRVLLYKVAHFHDGPYVPANIFRKMLITYMNKVIKRHRFHRFNIFNMFTNEVMITLLTSYMLTGSYVGKLLK